MQYYSQWHYILGYTIVLVSHNWPIMLCIAFGSFHAIRLYRRVGTREVRWLYSWAFFGFAYEYEKHLRAIFDEAVDFLLIQGLWQWNVAGHVATLLPLPISLIVAVWMFWCALRQRTNIVTNTITTTIGS